MLRWRTRRPSVTRSTVPTRRSIWPRVPGSTTPCATRWGRSRRMSRGRWRCSTQPASRESAGSSSRRRTRPRATTGRPATRRTSPTPSPPTAPRSWRWRRTAARMRRRMDSWRVHCGSRMRTVRIPCTSGASSRRGSVRHSRGGRSSSTVTGRRHAISSTPTIWRRPCRPSSMRARTTSPASSSRPAPVSRRPSAASPRRLRRRSGSRSRSGTVPPGAGTSAGTSPVSTRPRRCSATVPSCHSPRASHGPPAGSPPRSMTRRSGPSRPMPRPAPSDRAPVTAAAPAPAPAPVPTDVAGAQPAPRRPGPPAPSPLMRDALATIGTRFGLAVLIFGTDIALARLLGPAAKGRFALVLLYSQLAALIVGWGTDQALAVVSGRDSATARHGFANALVWTAIVGGAAVIGSVWLFGIPGEGPATGPLAELIPNLSGTQFMFAAVAVPGELFFGLGLFALLGRKRVLPYNLTRVVRRAVLLLMVLAVAALARLSLDVVLVLNLVALVISAAMILWVAATDGIVGGSPSRVLLAEELRFGSKALPGSLAERLQFRADSFLINIILGVRQTGVYSVTSGLAETLWYVPNALGTVMFSRAVDPQADAGRVASVLTRTTLAVALATAVPAFILGPRLVRAVYGTQFADAGVALRLILPGIVAYSVVAVLSRYITGRG